jgi:hypothetical protein
VAMAATRTAEKLRERKLNRMRLGKAVADVHSLMSDPEIKVALVPLSEAEYIQCLEATVNQRIADDTAGQALRDRYNSAEVLLRAAREPDDLEQPMFDSVEELTDALEVNDINFLQDMYFEMVETASPAIDGIPEEDLEDLKKALQTIDWNALSGRQWYALRRFLFSIMPELLQGNFSGVGSISKWTTPSDVEESTHIASLNSIDKPVKSAENQS